MTCRDVVGFLMDYISGDLEAGERARFEEHLRSCPQCVAYLRSYRDAVELGKDAFELTDASVPDELVQAILRVRRRV
jgi:anti-sigma factor RsiW